MDRKSKRAVMDALDKADGAYLLLIFKRNDDIVTVSNIEHKEDMPKMLRLAIVKLENDEN